MNGRIIGALAALAVTAGGLVAGAAPAMAAPQAAQHCDKDFFCAYINTNYNGLILKSGAHSGTRVDVGGGTSSGSNNTSNQWVGVDSLPGPIPDDDIFKWAPHTDANLGSAQNDKINYFNVK